MITQLLGSLGLHVDQNTWTTYFGKLLAATSIIAGGLLDPADLLYRGFGFHISMAADQRIIWWCMAVGIASSWWANQKTDRRNPASAGTQSRTGGGMTVGLLLVSGGLLCALSVVGCTALRELKPGPNGYTRAQVVSLLTDASWGLSEGCAVEWVSAPVCTKILPGLKTAKDVAEQAPAATVQADVVAVLQTIKESLPADSRAIPYFGYVIKLLGGQ